MLIDNDTKPNETILYIAAVLLSKIKEQRKINVALLNEFYKKTSIDQPIFKFQLSLNFLYLMNKVDIKGGELIYVP